ncbi:cytochrome C [Paraglaciecola aquimarina]|uniref:Cytochrome C n=1 Tax=Paraglaciecola algarum TaxID=3050085 RepID=A0ABS9D502_9ALTE|nr:cytochrome C [Paraglaciecola sp. G1-23]MCF2948018.1 cytochrome C [Paraglaciecola sp. G1-23]
MRFIHFKLPIVKAFCLIVFSQHSIAELTQNQHHTEGKVLVEQICTACHGLNQITRSSGYTLSDWKSLTRTMIDLTAQPEIEQKVFSYLATNYPPNTKRAPTLIAGDVKIEFTEWQTPTLGQRSRDPIEAPDGMIWWAGQRKNLIGSINPTTGKMREYSLPPNSMPHSVTVGPNSHIWYTGNKNSSVGKVDPDTGEVKVFNMPNPNAKDPHTAVFDANGILWFTAQHSNFIGRLNPNTGDIKLVTLPRPKSKPYGIKIDAKGNPWVACNGNNCLIKVDQNTMQLTEVLLPNSATRVRRLDIASDGTIWYVNSSQGKLGRYNPTTDNIKEWPTPSGKKSHPYAIAVVDDIVWFNESGMRPDPLVRFDPKTETFQSWPIPSGDVYAGIIRHMRPTRDGDLLIHQSSTNRIIRVKIQSP